MAAPTSRPWRIVGDIDPTRIWIEGAEGSASSDFAETDRRVVCNLDLVGDVAEDAETHANARLIVERVNGSLQQRRSRGGGGR